MSERINPQPPPVGQVAYNNPSQLQQQQQQYPPPQDSNHGSTDPYSEDDEEAMVESPIAPEIGGVYAPLMRLQYQRQVENSATVPLPRRVIGGLRDQVEYEQTRACYCQKSNCLKLYCECFSGGIHCNAYCNCMDCYNCEATRSTGFDRNDAIKACLEQNPHTFRPGINGRIPPLPPPRVLEEETAAAAAAAAAAVARSAANKPPDTPCNCSKSRCLKKYCECFRRDDFCNLSCKCQQCMNVRGNPTREKVVANARRKEANSRSRATTATAATADRKTVSRALLQRQAAPDAEPVDMNVASLRASNYSTAYPPSYYAVPMTLPNGEPSATLAFGQGSTLKKRKADAGDNGSGAFERAMATEEAVLARRTAEDDDGNTNGVDSPDRNAKQRPKVSLQVEMEQHWNEETRDVLGTFQAMRHELLQRKQDAGLLGVDIVLTREYSYYDLVGSAQIASVELELADVMTSLREAQEGAKEVIAKDVEQVGAETTEHGTARKLSESQRATIIAEAAQDTALMRELARIIRRRALEMSERL